MIASTQRQSTTDYLATWRQHQVYIVWRHSSLCVKRWGLVVAVSWSSVFSARQHICYSALYAIARPSVRPSVCLSHGWISQRWL